MTQKQLQGSQVAEDSLDLSIADGSTLTNVNAAQLNGFSVHTGIDGILKLDAAQRIPAVDGSLITNLAPSDSNTYGFNNDTPTRTVDITGDTMSGALGLGRTPPADTWNQGNTFYQYGHIGDQGSFGVAMGWNHYRTSSNVYPSLGANGSTKAFAIQLKDTGITFNGRASGTDVLTELGKFTEDQQLTIFALAPTSDNHAARKDYVDAQTTQESIGMYAGRWFLDATPSLLPVNFTGGSTTKISDGRYRLTFPTTFSNWSATFTQEFNSAEVYNIRIRLRSSTYVEIEILDSNTDALITSNEAVNFIVVHW